jgi:hypothetical protein
MTGNEVFKQGTAFDGEIAHLLAIERADTARPREEIGRDPVAESELSFKRSIFGEIGRNRILDCLGIDRIAPDFAPDPNAVAAVSLRLAPD